MANDLRVILPKNSMYASTPVYKGIKASVDGIDISASVFGLMRDVVVPHSTDIIFKVPVRGQERIDIISYHHYGTSELWWVIARVNNILDPLTSLSPGDEIRIPAKNRLASIGLLSV